MKEKEKSRLSRDFSGIKKMKDVIIIGGGIAGLSAGFELQKYNIDFEILEITNRVGGQIETIRHGGYLIESGPSTFSSQSFELLELIKNVGLEEKIIHASPSSKKRYIYFGGQLVQVPNNLREFIKTNLLTKSGKWTLFEELFIPKEEKEETVEDFFTRRFGREVLKNLIQPYLNGIFSGDIKKLSAQAVFPKLKELEIKHSSVFLGLLLSRKFLSPTKLTLFSLSEGIELLTEEIYKKLQNRITLNARDIEITRAKDFFIVSYKINNKIINHTTSAVLFATPAYKVLDYTHLFPSQHFTELFEIEYTPIATIAQTVETEKINHSLDGFGFLCTKEPQKKLLGTIWSSSIFPDRSPKGKVLLTSYIGGAYYKKIVDQTEEEIKNTVTKELCEILNISDPHLLETLHIKVHTHAIPQYHLEHLEKVKRIIEFMNKDYGLFFCGNYFKGISINDTVKTSKEVTEKIKRFLSTQAKKEKIAVSSLQIHI